MRVRVLGYESPFPGPNGIGPGFLLEHHDKYYLIDAGSGVLSQLQKYIDINQLEAVFLSHLHNDHMSDFLVIQHAIQIQFVLKGRTKPLPVYFPKEPTKKAELIPFQKFIKPSYIDEQTMLQLQDMDISFLKTDHSVPCYAMKFTSNGKSFVYGADSGTRTKFSPFADQVDFLILECTYLEQDKPLKPLGHLSTNDIVQLNQLLKPKKTMLTHLYPGYDVNEIKSEIINHNLYGEFYMPEYGKVIYI